ncbi:MAG: tetratricopeptide repeat protein [Prevotella sp.]
MKKLLLTILATISLYAEASFDQVQTMIDKQDYRQAKFALTVITQNHPDSAKAFYSLAQANAGLGDLIAAQSALDKAQALNPTLNFVPQSQVEQLKQAIQPQAKLITKVEEPSHWFRNLVIASIIGVLAVFGYRRFNKPKPIKEEPTTKYDSPKPEPTRSYEEPTSSTTYTPRTYATILYSEPVREIHHHHTAPASSPSTLETIAVAGITSAAVSSMMNNHESSTLVEPTHSSSWDSKPTHSYQPERISSTWDEPDNSWDEPTPSKSNSWSDSSSSSNSSWSE